MKVECRALDANGDELVIFGKKLIERITDEAPPPLTVTDIGVGAGIASCVFLEFGYKVTGVSLADRSKISLPYEQYTYIKEDFLEANVPQSDIVWASMVIEHMPNVGFFLERCRKLTKPDGWFCIVAPSDPTNLQVDGHLSFWTPAHLIYNMVVAGFDCSEARYYTQGRDIGLMVKRRDRPYVDLNYDYGDLLALSPYFPTPIIHRQTKPQLIDKF